MKKQGRPFTIETIRTHRALQRVFREFGFVEGKAVRLSTVELSALAERPKTKVIFALRYFEKRGLVARMPYRADSNGRAGQPPSVWKAMPTMLSEDIHPEAE